MMLMMKEYPPHDATMQKYAKAEPTDQRILPVLQALRNTQNEKIRANMATPSLSYDPATDLDI